MAGKPQRRASNPTVLAERVMELLDQVPGDRTVFLRFTRATESFRLETFRVNDPEPDKFRKTPGYYEVGTYRKGVSEAVVIQDLLDTMRLAR